ncbi:MAG TPA: hypothetical protein VNO18_11180 [Xanthobacteraceae bacterium]|nr:hypothetical protein [Xanthobacteraceae bacterium]
MNIAEGLSHDGIGCRRMAEYGPIGSRNIATLDCVVPKLAQRTFVFSLCELLNRGLMAPVKRFLDELSATLRLTCERNTLLAQIMIAGAFGAMHAKLDQQPTYFTARKTGIYRQAYACKPTQFLNCITTMPPFVERPAPAKSPDLSLNQLQFHARR